MVLGIWLFLEEDTLPLINISTIVAKEVANSLKSSKKFSFIGYFKLNAAIYHILF